MGHELGGPGYAQMISQVIANVKGFLKIGTQLNLSKCAIFLLMVGGKAHPNCALPATLYQTPILPASNSLLPSIFIFPTGNRNTFVRGEPSTLSWKTSLSRGMELFAAHSACGQA